MQLDKEAGLANLGRQGSLSAGEQSGNMRGRRLWWTVSAHTIDSHTQMTREAFVTPTGLRHTLAMVVPM